ncbi:MAG TPA: nitroreductase family deazaflavin-dependent oxidoreductase [Anaerolineaceae bacterium]
MENKLGEKLRAGFKQFNKFMLFLWRLGLGPWVNMWPNVGGRIMVLVHTGRKSGQRRLTPVNYAIIDGDIYCAAGFGSVADWYRNIEADSKVEVMLPDGWWEGKAEEIVDVSGNLPVLRQVLVASGIVAPMMGVRPKKMVDAELEKISTGYKVVRIRRTAARTGPGGPCDLAWFWPAATFVLAGMLWLKKKEID